MLKIELSKNLKPKPDFNNLGFGKYFTDHMFMMNYTEEKGWHDERIVPYQNLVMDPSTLVFHYSQTIFEGLKAYKDKNGHIRLFRPAANFARMNSSATRTCIPNIDENLVLNALKELIKIEKSWIPDLPGTSLYIRPTIIATDAVLGVKASSTYLFYIILSPVGAYYKNGLAPTRILIEEFYTRASHGGTGEIKAGANYAISLMASEKAKKLQYDQVLWLDAKDKKYIEEVGSMNIFFVIDNEVVTPELYGSILPGITRDSVIKLLKSFGYKVTEKRISVEELKDAAVSGKLNESFGTGTAAVISPIGWFKYLDKEYTINDGKMGEISTKLYNTLTGMQNGTVEDRFNWVVNVNA